AMMFLFSSRRRHTSFSRDWSSDVCSSDLASGSSSDRRSSKTLPAINKIATTTMISNVIGVIVYCSPSVGKRPLNLNIHNFTNCRSEERRVGKDERTRRAEDDRKQRTEKIE